MSSKLNQRFTAKKNGGFTEAPNEKKRQSSKRKENLAILKDLYHLEVRESFNR